MRLAQNLNYYIYWESNDEVCVGELGCLVRSEKKVWTLNDDCTLSPGNNMDYVVGVATKDEGMVLQLLE
mgnify:CR=1 FL=1